MNFYKSIVIGLVIVMSSCKKEIVEIPESNQPIFTINGTIGLDSINYVVGDDNSIFNSSISKFNGINFFGGKLINSETEIEFGLFSGDNDFQAIITDSILKNTNFKFAELSTEDVFEFDKSLLVNSSHIKEIKWFIDGEYAGTNSLIINNPGKYYVCANIIYSNGSTGELCNELLVGYKRNSNFILKYDLFGNNQINCWIDSPNNNISGVKWYINDVLVSNLTNLASNIDASLNTIKAEITFANGSKRIRSILIDGNSNLKSIEDFACFENENQSFWDYKLKLSVKHLGDEFSSINVANENSIFQVNSIKFLGNDLNNNPIYVFTGVLDAKVKSKLSNETLDVKLNISWGFCIK